MTGTVAGCREKMYREQARLVCTKQAEYYSKMMGVTYGRIAIKNTRKLVLMPPAILDYVVVHELAHRKEMNHSSRFWAEVEKILPDYRERRKWLKEHGNEY